MAPRALNGEFGLSILAASLLRGELPTYVVPMHCTGEVFIQEALRTIPQKIIRPYVGTELVSQG